MFMPLLDIAYLTVLEMMALIQRRKCAGVLPVHLRNA